MVIDMGKEKFIDELKNKLNYLSQEEREKVVTYYNEIIDDKIEDGMTEGDAVLSLGSMDEIEEMIREEVGNSKKETDVKGERKKYICKNDVGIIHVSDKNTSIEINPTSGEKVYIEYYEDEYNKYDILENEDTILIKKLSYPRYIIFKGFFGSLIKTKLIINIPLKSMVNKLEVLTTNASINCIDLSVPRIELESNNGAINIKNIDSSNGIKLQTTNAKLDICSVKSHSMIECDTSNAAIVLQDVKSNDNIKLKTINGTVKINSVDSKNLTVKTSNGSIKFDYINVEEHIDLKSSNADIRGNIKGKIEEFNITSKTSNAKNNLPTSLKLGNKNLTAITSNGSINVEFI